MPAIQRGTTVRSLQGDTVDLICHRHYGRTAGTTEAVLEANPGLAALGPVLPDDTEVFIPQIAAPTTRKLVQLWD